MKTKLCSSLRTGLAVVLLALPLPAFADGTQGTSPEIEAYRSLEMDAPDLQDFRGGCPGPEEPILLLFLPLILVMLPIAILYSIVFPNP